MGSSIPATPPAPDLAGADHDASGGPPPTSTADPGRGPRAAAGVRDRLVTGLAAIAPAAGIYAASRVTVLAAIWIASRIDPSLTIGKAVMAWDGTRYLGVVIDGYPNFLPLQPDGRADFSNLAFFPLYPVCIQALRALGFSAPIAGLIVAGAAGLAATILLWVLLERLWGRDVAARGVALFCFFPGALVLSLVYSEPLMLALSIGCLLCLLSRRWLASGVLAGLATAARPNAVVLVAVCGWAALEAIRERRQWWALVAPVLAPTGFAAFHLFLWARTGVGDAYVRTNNEAWQLTLSPNAFPNKLRLWLRHPFEDVNLTLTLACTAFLAVTLILLVRARLPAPVVVYALGLAAMTLTSTSWGSQPRFLFTAFPLVVLPARYLRGTAFSVVLGSSAVALGALTILTLTTRLATP